MDSALRSLRHGPGIAETEAVRRPLPVAAWAAQWRVRPADRLAGGPGVRDPGATGDRDLGRRVFRWAPQRSAQKRGFRALRGGPARRRRLLSGPSRRRLAGGIGDDPTGGSWSQDLLPRPAPTRRVAGGGSGFPRGTVKKRPCLTTALGAAPWRVRTGGGGKEMGYEDKPFVRGLRISLGRLRRSGTSTRTGACRGWGGPFSRRLPDVRPPKLALPLGGSVAAACVPHRLKPVRLRDNCAGTLGPSWRAVSSAGHSKPTQSAERAGVA